MRSLGEWFPAAGTRRSGAAGGEGVGGGAFRRALKERQGVALRWLGEGEPRVPPELEALFRESADLQELRIFEACPEVEVVCPGLPGGDLQAHLTLLGEDSSGPVAIVVEGKRDEPFGDRAGSLLRHALRTGGTRGAAEVAERIHWLDAALLPPWQEGLAPLEELRLRLLEGVAAALAHARSLDTSRAVFVVHEVVELAKTSEARRRNNREDLDRFVRRLTDGGVERLQRGVLAGPVQLPARGRAAPFPSDLPAGTRIGWGEIQLFLGKVRCDLPSGARSLS